MADLELGGDIEFISEEVAKIIDDAIYYVYGIKPEEAKEISTCYSKEKVNVWCGQIID